MNNNVSISKSAKKFTIIGSAFMHFYNLMYSFTMPIILPAILGTYGIMDKYTLILGINALLACIITPIGGKLGDHYGRHKIGLIASIIRLFLMVACSVRTKGWVFIILYTSNTIVASILVPSSHNTNDVTTPEERSHYFGIFGTINGIALLVGLLGGGLIIDYIGPFTSFLFFVPIGLAYTLILAVSYTHKIKKEDYQPIDKIGIFLLGSGISSILIWCNFGGHAFERTSLIGISLLIIGVILLYLLIWYENRVEYPFINPKYFNNKSFLLSFLTSALIAPMVCLCSGTLALFGQVSLGLSATVSGTMALPKNIIFLILPTFMGAWIKKDLNRFRTVFLACGFSIAIGGALSSCWDISTSLWTVYFVMIIFGIGTSCQSVCIQPYMNRNIPSKDLGTATSIVSFATSLGVAIYNAIYSISFNENYNITKTVPEIIQKSLPPEILNSISDPNTLKKAEHVNEIRSLLPSSLHKQFEIAIFNLRSAMANTFSLMAVVCSISGILIIIATLKLMPYSSNRKIFSSRLKHSKKT